MSSRQKTVWLLLLILSVTVLGFQAVQLYPLQKQWWQARTRAQNLQFGTDKELENIIDFLEVRLRARSSFIFNLETEPMYLTNVIYLTDAMGRPLRYRQRGKLRVTAIIDGNTQQAIINYRDKNYTVTVGDSVAGGEIIWIDSDEVVLAKENKEYHYQVVGLLREEDVTMQNNHRSEY